MDATFGQRLHTIRTAEDLTQTQFQSLTEISIEKIRSYEAGAEVGLSIIKRVLSVDQFQKYTLWLMLGKTGESAGQISPALSHSGQEKTE